LWLIKVWFSPSDSRNVCPNGWHVPTDIELNTHTKFLGGTGTRGIILKSTTQIYWSSFGATNETGFSALPSGIISCYGNGSFANLGVSSNYWTSTEYPLITTYAWGLQLGENSSVYRNYHPKEQGYAIRCLKE
jgi:uncharacterized protein (TIGR02145 family)